MIAPLATEVFADPANCEAVASLGLLENPFAPGLESPGVCVEGSEGIDYWLQQRTENRWQAQARDDTYYPDGVFVEVIDWGDNLEPNGWYSNPVARVETVLYKDVSATPMLGCTMHLLWDQGPEERHGASGTRPGAAKTTVSDARIYTDCARSTIQKVADLPAEGEAPTLPLEGLTWDGLKWTVEGVGPDPVFGGSVYEAGDGRTFYSAESNIGGDQCRGPADLLRQVFPGNQGQREQ